MYLPISGLDLDQWCSDENPQGSCVALRDICKPMTWDALDTFKELQRACNRVAEAKGWKYLDVDGRIGPLTRGMVNKIVAGKWASFPHCDQVAGVADELLRDIMAMADAMGAPFVYDPVSKSPPSVKLPGGKVGHPDQKDIPGAQPAGLFGGDPLVMAAAVVGGLLVWQYYGKPKKKGKKKAVSGKTWF